MDDPSRRPPSERSYIAPVKRRTSNRLTSTKDSATPAEKPHLSTPSPTASLISVPAPLLRSEAEPIAYTAHLASASTYKRKSSAVDSPAEPSSASSRPSRRRRTSANTPAQPHTPPALQPSAKALGKRRAISLSPDLPSPVTRASKKRKVDSATGERPNYNLRSRAPKVVISGPKPEEGMPRKGSPATRAAKAKAKAREDDGEDSVASASNDYVPEFDEATVAPKPPAQGMSAVEDDHMDMASPDSEHQAEHEEGNNSDSHDSHDDHSNEDDDEEEDMDEDDEDYEADLAGRDDPYGSPTDDVGDAPQTYDANGEPVVPHGSSSTPGAAMDAAMSAAIAGFGSGRPGAGLRALQGMISGISTRFKSILNTLKASDTDARTKLVALQELAEILSVSTEDTLAGYFQVESFTKALIEILQGTIPTDGDGVVDDSGMTKEELAAFGMTDFGAGGGAGEESHVQMMLLACRCLANLMEALPGTAHAVVFAGAVPVLCSKLLEIQYIDLAEQTLSTLEKISEEMPSAIVRGDGLSALLTYLDFFSFHVQRTAVTAAANCCRGISPEHFDKVKDVMPIFKNILGYPDQRVVEQGCLALVRIVESYRHHPDKLEALLTTDVLSALRALLNPDSSTIGSNTYTQVLKMLSIAARASPEVAMTLIDQNVADTLYQLLTGVAAPENLAGEKEGFARVGDDDDMLVLQNLVQRPKDQIQEALGVVCELLPSLPRDGIFDSKAHSAKQRSSRSTKVKMEEASASLRVPSGSTSPSRAQDAVVKHEDALAENSLLDNLASSSASTGSSRPRDAAKEAVIAKRLELLNGGSERRMILLRRFYSLLLPTLVDVYAATVNSSVRSKTVIGMLKIVNYCDDNVLSVVMKSVPMASFIAAILASRDQEAPITSALQLVEMLLVKLPDTYQYFFRKEGVMHEIERIASQPILTVPRSKRASPTRSSRTSDVSVDPPDVPISSALTRALRQHAAGRSAEATSTPAEPSASVPAISAIDISAKDALTLRARHLRKKYASDAGQTAKASKALEKIKDIAARLQSPQKRTSTQVAKLARDVALLFKEEKSSLSSFELLESGLVDALLHFAAEPTLSSDEMCHRHQTLGKMLMECGPGSSTSPFSVLVKRLQEGLSRMEEFEVALAAPGSSDGSKRDGTSMLARQLKLRLVADERSDVPRSCTNIVVSIHAIATFQAFNDYLRPRILAATTIAERNSAASTSAPSAGGRFSGFLAALAATSGDNEALSDFKTNGIGLTTAVASSSRLSASLGAVDAAVGSGRPTGTTDENAPKRRRSKRLSAKSEPSTLANLPSSSRATLDHFANESLNDDSILQDDADVCPEPADDDEDEDLFHGSFDTPIPPREDRPVNLEVADDGSKIIAKTPDGTRVSTPILNQGEGHSMRVTSTLKPRASYAAAVKAEPTDFHLEFSMGDQDVPLDHTVFGAVHNLEEARSPELSRSIWTSVYTVKFRKVSGPARSDSVSSSPNIPPSAQKTGEAILSSLSADSRQSKILQVLGVLQSINCDFAEASSFMSLAESAFVNNKLTAKLNRQLEEPMIVASACLPSWSTELPTMFPFLFPFDTRYSFLQSTAFGYARLMQKWVSQARTDNHRRDDNLGFLGRLQRQKVRISRERILDSAYKVFELYGANRASLEVEFFNEVGSGLGPTLEFYALVSKEFARKDLDLWRASETSETSEYIHSMHGLFPGPLADRTPTEQREKTLKIFRILGQFVAKAIMDTRIIDVNFNRFFMKIVLGQEVPLNVASVKSVDKALGNSLEHLQRYVKRKSDLEDADDLLQAANEESLCTFAIDGVTVDDLSLDFTLPGYDIELKPNGKSIAVDGDNIEEYIALVIDWTVGKGVAVQLESFKSGFSTVFPVHNLQSFTPSELVMMTGAIDEDWSVETLTSATKADHGYTMDSRPVRDLLSMMSNFTPAERRTFLSFITGSPRLPIGGFAALTPSLTIVRKEGGDGSLPSVMTCVNYIKLPNYSSYDIVKDRVVTAVKEGAGGFHLS